MCPVLHGDVERSYVVWVVVAKLSMVRYISASSVPSYGFRKWHFILDIALIVVKQPKDPFKSSLGL